MPRVPVYDSQVNADTAVIPQPKQSPRPPIEAFGLGNIKANMDLAEKVGELGNVLTSHAARMAAEDNRKAFIKADSEFRTELQNTLLSQETDENGRPVGLLNRKLSQANGSVEEFDKIFKPISDKYMKMVPPSEQGSMLESIKSGYQSSREAVLKNVVDERNKDFELSLKSNIDSVISGAAIIHDPNDLRNSIEKETENIGKSLFYLTPNNDYVEASKKNIASDMVKTSVNSLLDTDYKKAKLVLERNKDLIQKSVYADLTKTIEAKSVDDLKLSTWNALKSFTLPDGNSDLEKMRASVYAMNIPTDKKDHVWDYVRSSANVQDSILKDKRESTNRQFTNDIITQHAQGLDYQSALRVAAKYAYDPTDLANKQKDITDLYSGKLSNFDLWINKQPEETQAAWDYAKNVLKTKFDDKEVAIPGTDSKVNLYQAAVSELKIQALNKSPESIREMANEKISKVVVSPDSWFNSTNYQISEDINKRQTVSSAISKYDPALVSQAKDSLRKRGIEPSDQNVLILFIQKGIK